MFAADKNKDFIRKYAASAKRSIGSGLAQKKNVAAVSRLLAHPAYCNASIILAYFPVENEMDISEGLESAAQEGKKIAFPVWDGQGGIIAAIPEKNKFEIDRYGAIEPTLFRSKIVTPAQIDLIIVPGLAFDSKGHRIGWGGGHYGRYIPLCKNAHRLGVAYEEQILPRIAENDADTKVDSILTDRHVYSCNNNITIRSK